MGEEAVNDSDLLAAIESWWKCVRLLESELDETLETKLHYRGPYDLLGIYGHRELLERYVAGRDSAATNAADGFLLSFSERLERDWTADLGVGRVEGMVGGGIVFRTVVRFEKNWTREWNAFKTGSTTNQTARSRTYLFEVRTCGMLG